MKKLSKFSSGKQSGFTLVELIIVIVIIGILSAVAVIKMTNVTDAANRAANKAVLGMVKSAWSAAYAVAKTTPTMAQVAAQTGDPSCPASTAIALTIVCPVSWTTASPAGGNLTITAVSMDSPGTFTCTSGDCDPVP